ncbi:MAG TPA: ABC transporter permease [Acidimicrobiales bacterium]|nr:ABC transporter permease [Acidimicrobiales bacterium]
MTTVSGTGTPAVHAARPKRKLPRAMILVGLGVILLSIVRVVADADDLTSAGSFSAAIRLGVPILLAGLGGLFAERCGVVNIGLEGMLILGTWFGAWGAVEFGAWEGVLLGIFGGALGGLIHAVATVTFGVDHIVSGVAINILGAGMARYLSVVSWVGKGTGGGATQSPKVTVDIAKVDVPFLAGGSIFGWDTPDVLGRIASWRWVVISDVAGLLRGLTGNLSLLSFVALLLVPASVLFLWHTPLGLRLRSAGENPYAAESLGVNVYRMKYLGVITSGALAGLGGAFLVLEGAGIYREGQTGGRGFIGLAALIFGNWRPTGVAMGAGLFGFADALRLRNESAVHALLLFVAVAAALAALWLLFDRRYRYGAVIGAIAVGFGIWYVTSDTVPRQFLSFTPHITTLLVLAFATQRLRPPAADGLPYRKGGGT